jgi:hypothetical protein
MTRSAADKPLVSRPRDHCLMPVVAAVLTMSAAQLFDLATFWTMVHQLGPAAEANPLVAFLFGTYGFPLVAITKVVLLAVVTAIGAILLRRPRTAGLALAIIVIGTVFGLAGGISNAIAIGGPPLV